MYGGGVGESQKNASAHGPKHICVVMDGNRRWAKCHGMPVAMGHVAGARRVKGLVKACIARGIPYVTIFAFSTENWKRPQDEVVNLMGLLSLYLNKEVRDMQAQDVRLKIVGDVSRLDASTQTLIQEAETLTANNHAITLTVAINYGGRWDVLQGVKAWKHSHPQESLDALGDDDLAPHLAMAHAPEPDLMIRTGGESRLSNFMLWQLAYTELYFSEVLWPAFDDSELDKALAFFQGRDRRFGGASAQHISNRQALAS